MWKLSIALGLCAIFFAAHASAQQPELVQEPPEERHYIGLGMEPWQIGQDVSAFGVAGRDTLVDNQDRRFSGLVLAGRLLPRGPAEQAGLTESDVIVSYDGNEMTPVSREAMVSHIRSGRAGEPVRLVLRRFGAQGELGVPFTVDVPRGMIDSVAWLPLGFEWGGSQCSHSMAGPSDTDGCIEVGSTLTEDKDAGEFVYRFRFKNTYKTVRTLQWEVFDKAAQYGFDMPLLLELKPDVDREFTLRSKLLPAKVSGKACTFSARSFTDNRYVQGHAFKSDTDDASVMAGDSCSTYQGFIPRKYARE